MPEQKEQLVPFSQKRWWAGLSNFLKEDFPNGFYYSQSIDYRTNPQELQLLPASLKESGALITDLLKWADTTPEALDVYMYGSTGNIYKRTNLGLYSKLHTVLKSHGNGLAYFYGDDYLYYTSDTTIGRFGPLSLLTSLNPLGVSPYRGVSISGLEFGSNIPGALNVDYFISSQNTFNYFAAKGFTTVRLPFSWERIQPTIGGSLDATYKGYIDDQITKAKNAGMSVILDVHNFGRRKIYNNGGITENFTSQYPNLLYPWADYSANGSIVLRNYGQAFLGTTANPVASNGYTIAFNMKFNTRDDTFGGEGLHTRPMYADANNYYDFIADLADGTWTLNKVVAGVTTQLATGVKAWGTTNTYAILIDVNQGTNGKINVSVNGSALYTVNTVNSDAALPTGKIGFWPQGVHVRLDTMVLNINGDTSTGGVAVYRVGDAQLTTANFASLWTQLSTAYVNNGTVLGYDLMNEPHDMPVPTTPSNYNTTSSVTLMNQAAINAIRAVDTTHYILAELDSFAGMQSFVSQYGSNPTPWLTDSANLLVYSGHYYFDNNHSGTYGQPFASSNNTNIPGDVTPFMSWCQTNNLTCHCGEFGVPNQTAWQVCLTTFMGLCNQYNVWTNHWAAGDAYSSITTLQPTGSPPNYIDQLQMAILSLPQNLQNLSSGTQPVFVDDFLKAVGGIPTNTASLLLASKSSQYATAASAASLQITSDLTLETELKCNSFPAINSSMTIVGKWDESVSRSYKLDLYAVSGFFGNGQDGALTISSNTTEAPIDAAATAVAGQNTVNSNNNAFAQGQRILVIQMQGPNAGAWIVTTVTGYSGGIITTSDNMNFSYGSNGAAQCRVIPQYTNVTINGGVTYSAKQWNGTTGGILCFLANGTVTVTGTISATGAGFRGGAGAMGENVTATQGESTIGLGTTSTANNGIGGGGSHKTFGAQPAGSGGGGYATAGANGANGGGQNNPSLGGTGGNTYGAADLTTMILGGGSGGGAGNSATQNGVNGGGIIFMMGATLIVTGSVVSNGSNGTGDGGNGEVACIGGGAGGSVLMKAQIATLGTTLVTALGGTGATPSGANGAGGNGGNGRIHLGYLNSYTGTTNPTMTVVQDNTLVTTVTIQARLGISDDGTGYEYLSQNLPTLALGQWTRLTVTWVAALSLATFYLNGVAVGTFTGGRKAIKSNASALSVGANKVAAYQNFFDGEFNDMRVWNLAQSAALVAQYANTQLTGKEAGLVAYYTFNSVYTDGTANANNLTAFGSPKFVTDVPFSAPTTRQDIDQQSTGGANTYTLPTAISEAGTDSLSFTPLLDPQKSVDLQINAKGTGNWTVLVHDQQNNVVATLTVPNANLPASGFYEFVWPTLWRIVINKSYHIHAISSVNDGSVKTGTAANFSTANFHTYYSFLVNDTSYHPIIRMLNKIIIGNERYLATWDGANYNANFIAFPQGTHVRCFGFWRDYLAIGVWQENLSGVGNIYDYAVGRVYFWDGISLTFNFWIDIAEGQVNAMYGIDTNLYIWAGWQGQLVLYQGGYIYASGNSITSKIRRMPFLESDAFLEIYPQAMTMWRGLMHIGVGGNSNSATLPRAVYSYGTLQLPYPESLSLDYPISTGNLGQSVKIGLVYAAGQTLLIGWQDNTGFGCDQVNFLSNPAAAFGTIQTNIIDNNEIWHQESVMKVRADHAPLNAGESIAVKYKIDREANWETAGSLTDAVTSKFTEIGAADGRGREFQFAVDMFSTQGTSPTLYGLSELFNPQPGEKQF